MLFKKVARTLFKASNDRQLKKAKAYVKKINQLEEEYSKLNDVDLRNQTAILKSRVNMGTSLEEILPEAFAVVREAATRTLGQRHYDVQLMGGVILHEGKVAEMCTGEGKTLVATLPAYLNALSGRSVHIVTVNDYLAKRDSEWMGVIYKFLGLEIACLTQEDRESEQKRKIYNADIIYGTNNEFGFDYLRDNLKHDVASIVQKPFHYAIIDEVDSILIDEARTPLIISGQAENSSELYKKINSVVSAFKKQHYEIDEKMRTALLTDLGNEHAETLLRKQNLINQSSNLYDINNVAVVHHLNQALRAHHLFKKDVDYVIHKGKIMIIDEFTGRILEGRRYSDGLHQAIEAKEKVKIQDESQTIASITFQNFFRMYPKIAGMTGTAMTEARELEDIYGLKVVAIPTNMQVIRNDEDDIIYRTLKEKYKAIVNAVRDAHDKKQPVLIGTASIEKSEELSALLKGIPHNVLNAKNHAREAEIIAQAGKAGAVTIATNMAGRGTDIKLGGSEDYIDSSIAQDELKKIYADIQNERQFVKEVGGLKVIGTERHESRRVDNQLKGRAGRQGDPGNTVFFLSLEG